MNEAPETILVAVRRRWNGAQVGYVALGSLRQLRVRNEPGGVCGPLPRAFLHADIWCDALVRGEVGHVCRDGPPPHELPVCILAADNPARLYEQLLSLASARR